jgi:hypothetical protein
VKEEQTGAELLFKVIDGLKLVIIFLMRIGSGVEMRTIL